MSKNNYLEEVDRWKTLSLLILLLLGLVGGLSYNLLIRQKAMIEDKDFQIQYLNEELSTASKQTASKK